MKYIIDIEDEYAKDWVNETPMCKELCMPISVPNRQRTYHVGTGFKLEPYTEPDRKAIEDEVWQTAIEIDRNTDNYDWQDMTYQEAKARYDAWKKQMDEIRVGDEVTFYIGPNDEMKAVALDQTGIEGEWSLFTENGCVEEHAEDFIRKTGRHFDDVEELLEKMKGG